MKKFLFFITLFTFLTQANAAFLTGEVEYNAENAKSETFSAPFEKIDYNIAQKHYYSNESCLKIGINEFSDRKVVKFSDGSYGVKYYNDPLYSWYYSSDGKLINFTKRDAEGYPARVTKYKPDGSIANIGYQVTQTESFIFTQNGTLLAHWLGKFCYDKNGNIIMTRDNF